MKKERQWHKKLHKVTSSPHLQLVAGLLLLVMTLLGSVVEPHHYPIVIGVYYVAQAVPEIVQALERIDKGIE